MTRCAPRGVVVVMHRLPVHVRYGPEAMDVPAIPDTQAAVKSENATVRQQPSFSFVLHKNQIPLQCFPNSVVSVVPAACPRGTYKPEYGNQDCTSCPDLSTTAIEGSISQDACECLPGHEGTPKSGDSCARKIIASTNMSSILFRPYHYLDSKRV